MAACFCRGSANGGGRVDKAAILEKLRGSKVPIHDTLLLDEMIDWYTSRHLQDVEEMLQEEADPSRNQIDEQFTATTLKLFVLYGRAFIIQLLFSVAKYDFDRRVGTDEYCAVLGCVRFLHQELCRCNDSRFANVMDLSKIFELCLEELEKEFDKFFMEKQRDGLRRNGLTGDGVWPKAKASTRERTVLASSSMRRSSILEELENPSKNITSKMLEELEKPSQNITSKIKATTTKNNLTGKGSSVENYNYRSAYTMMVGLDCSIRVKGAMKLYRIMPMGVGKFSTELRADLVEQGLRMFAEAVLRKTYAEAQMSTDAVLLCLSAITLRFNLPSGGSPFSRKHLLGDDENLWLEEYAPVLFGECRKVFNIGEDEYKKSVSRTGFSFIEFASNSKSGEMFFFSWDGKYIIKTISEKEVNVLIKMLPKYLQHISKPSLLMRICGLYRVSVSKDYAPRYFLIAISVFDAGDMGLHHQFDLKGSTVNRISKEEESVQKDINWVQGNFQVNLPAGLKRTVAAALENDANFLKAQSVLDYSVLVGIHDRESKLPGKQNKGVRLLQGIVKQKLLPQIKKLRAQSFSGSQPFQYPKSTGASNGASADWLNFMAKGTGSPAHLPASKQRLPSDDARQFFSISRLPSCTSDPYEASEFAASAEASSDYVSDDYHVYPAIDTEQDEWQRLRAWLPPLPTAPDEAADVIGSGGCDFDFGPRILADISENSPLRIGMGRPHASIAVSQEIHTLVQELDELSRLGRFGESQEVPHDQDTAIGEDADFQATRYSVANAEEAPRACGGGGKGKSFVALNVGSAPRIDSLWRSSPRAATPDICPTLERNGSASCGSVSPIALARGNSSCNSGSPIAVARPVGVQAISVRKSVKTKVKGVDKGQRLLIFADADGEKGWSGMHGPISAADSRGEHGRYVYYIGIIDFLVPWDAKKKGEYVLNCLRGRGYRASCVPPSIYANRQIDFILRSMMGLFDVSNAKQYATASVTLPPPKMLRNVNPNDAHQYCDVSNVVLANAHSSPLASDVITKYGVAHTTENADADMDTHPETRQNRASEEELVGNLKMHVLQRWQNSSVRVGQDNAHPETDTGLLNGDIERSPHSLYHIAGAVLALRACIYVLTPSSIFPCNTHIGLHTHKGLAKLKASHASVAAARAA